ncbi:MAG TPA: hypothetical protein DF774_13680 [Rheinheimera sp.]|uniref:energy-coupling factor ABC transporter permease n=1 Tax=Rheinheimera sp. TaxID=1869214 RepID=UPI000EE01BC6|nr:energy-coupling factor ABC transporter permease [Rheinheimera sp.]HCU66802.1 hypothetical protein [Rheinheimera sp.]
MLWLLCWLLPLYYLTLDKKLLTLWQQPLLRQLFAGSGLCLLVLWQVKAQLPQGPALHFLGITAVTLLLGLRLSLCLIPAILLTTVAASWLVAPAKLGSATLWLADWAVLTVLALQSYLQLYLVHRQFGQHLFVYIFLAAFIGSALCTVSFVLLQSSALWLLQPDVVLDPGEYLALSPLLALPEAILNGMAITLLLVYRPEWVATYRQNTEQ